MNRRAFLHTAAVSAAAQAPSSIVVDPSPQFEISPYLYMQFMEPLGVTDSSVEAAWDYERDDWRADFVETVRDLAPTMIRWGGLYSRYYRWREGIGPADKRPWMRNYVWGGKETNRVGTDEFIDLCRRVGAEPLFCVNFLSDGETRYTGRSAGAEEAADWAAYAKTKFWQIGNETSYGKVCFTKEDAIHHTVQFARAMKARNPQSRLIGWGDSGWAADMAKQAGAYLDYIAIHMMGQSPRRPDTVLRGTHYQANPEQAWAELLELADRVETRLQEVENAVDFPLAVTEGHLSIRPSNANPILLEWLSAVYHARSMNIYQRHGNRVKIATAADFEGSRWTVNAVMLQVPGGRSYLTPAGSVMRLFRRHGGTHAVRSVESPPGLDIAASRTGDRIFLHVANTEYRREITSSIAVQGSAVKEGRLYQIAPANLRQAVGIDEPDVFKPVETAFAQSCRFPPGSVSAIEFELGR